MRSAMLVLTALSLACSTTKVTVDSDRAVDFRRFHSYSWATAPAPGPNPLVTKQIVAAVDGELRKKGLTRVAEGGSLSVRFRVEVGRGVDVASSGAGPRWRSGSAQVRTVGLGTLVVDLADGRSGELLWRATARDQIDPEVAGAEREERLRDVAEKMFRDFPSTALTTDSHL